MSVTKFMSKLLAVLVVLIIIAICVLTHLFSIKKNSAT